MPKNFTMKIAEIFYSIQGEGSLVGVPSVFVRTTGCNLRCWFCDTPYTSWEPEGISLSVGDILRRVEGYNAGHVVVTGGEPMLAPEIEELCAGLRRLGMHITIETAGTIFKPVACDLASLSPKLRSSTPWQRDAKLALRHEEMRLNLAVLRAFMNHCAYQFKFVIDTPEDIQEVRQILGLLPPLELTRILLMPQGVTRQEIEERAGWIAEACKEHGFRYCPRLHLDLFGHQRGT